MSDAQYVRHGRPVLVWLISAFFFLSAIWTLLSFYMVLSGAIPLEPAQKAYLDRLTPIDYSLAIVLGSLNLAGAVMLFLLRKIALYLFLTAFALSVVLMLWHVATKGWAEAAGAAMSIGALMGYVLSAMVCIYAWRLSKKGVLH
jgi:hypothetical protein